MIFFTIEVLFLSLNIFISLLFVLTTFDLSHQQLTHTAIPFLSTFLWNAILFNILKYSNLLCIVYFFNHCMIFVYITLCVFNCLFCIIVCAASLCVGEQFTSVFDKIDNKFLKNK